MKTKKGKKTAKTKTSKQRTKLNAIAAQVRRMLRRDTISAVEIGKLLLQSRAMLADEHGQWKPWLAKNFDLSYRTALNYCGAAEYVAAKNASVALFRNLAPTVLYGLHDGLYSEQVEAEILAEAKAGNRIDQGRVEAIRERLSRRQPPPMPMMPMRPVILRVMMPPTMPKTTMPRTRTRTMPTARSANS
jgi:hypothetical protein